MRKKVSKKAPDSLSVLIAVFILLAAAAVYYLFNQNEMDRRGDIVGDRLCGDLIDSSGQDSCCAKVHADELHVLCEGEWKYLSGLRRCQYICSGVLPRCSEDFRVCESGDVVGRNPEHECEFENCP